MGTLYPSREQISFSRMYLLMDMFDFHQGYRSSIYCLSPLRPRLRLTTSIDEIVVLIV